LPLKISFWLEKFLFCLPLFSTLLLLAGVVVPVVAAALAGIELQRGLL
jgi:hypothetical protein